MATLAGVVGRCVICIWYIGRNVDRLKLLNSTPYLFFIWYMCHQNLVIVRNSDQLKFNISQWVFPASILYKSETGQYRSAIDLFRMLTGLVGVSAEFRIFGGMLIS